MRISASNFKEKLIPLIIFIILGLIAMNVPFSQLAGSKVQFTLFDLFAPSVGAFLGTYLGIFAVFATQLANFTFGGFEAADKGAIIRLFPILFGVLFFSRAANKNSQIILLIPLLAIIIWNINPVGKSVWYYSLFWTIPFAVYPLVKKSLVARSLASVFIAHSVGGAVWIWAFNLPASVWQGLIPVVALERSIMALGVCASYILMNNIAAYLDSKKLLIGIKFDKKYLLINSKS